MKAATLTYRPFANLTMPRTATVHKADKARKAPAPEMIEAVVKLSCKHTKRVKYMGHLNTDHKTGCLTCPPLKSGKVAMRSIKGVVGLLNSDR